MASLYDQTEMEKDNETVWITSCFAVSSVWVAHGTCGKALVVAGDWGALPDAGTLLLGSGPALVEFAREESPTSASL